MKNYFLKMPLVLGSVLFIVFLYASVFLYGLIIDNNQKAEKNIQSWQTETRRRDEISSLNRSIKKITEDKILLESHFAKGSDVVPFLNTIEKLASSAGASAEVNSVDTGNTELTVGLKVSGSWTAVYKFLKLLENSPYELEVLSLDMHKISTGGEAKTGSDWEAIFSVRLLSFIP